MKKLVLVAVIGLAFASCKKDYTCECITKDGSNVESTVDVTVHDTKSGAKTTCENGNSTVGSISTACAIK